MRRLGFVGGPEQLQRQWKNSDLVLLHDKVHSPALLRKVAELNVAKGATATYPKATSHAFSAPHPFWVSVKQRGGQPWTISGIVSDEIQFQRQGREMAFGPLCNPHPSPCQLSWRCTMSLHRIPAKGVAHLHPLNRTDARKPVVHRLHQCRIVYVPRPGVDQGVTKLQVSALRQTPPSKRATHHSMSLGPDAPWDA